MKISCELKKSRIFHLLDWLFVDKKENLFKDSKLLGLLSKLDNPKLSIICLGVSLACLWYENLFVQLGLGLVQSLNFGIFFLIFSLLFCSKKRIRSTKALVFLLLFIVSLAISGLWAAVNGFELRMILSGIVLLSQFAIAFVIASTYKSKTLIINLILVLSVPVLLVGCCQGMSGEQTSTITVLSPRNG